MGYVLLRDSDRTAMNQNGGATDNKLIKFMDET